MIASRNPPADRGSDPHAERDSVDRLRRSGLASRLQRGQRFRKRLYVMYSLATRGKSKDQSYKIRRPLRTAPAPLDPVLISVAPHRPSGTTFPSRPSPAPRSTTWGKRLLNQKSALINPPAIVLRPLITAFRFQFTRCSAQSVGGTLSGLP